MLVVGFWMLGVPVFVVAVLMVGMFVIAVFVITVTMLMSIFSTIGRRGGRFSFGC